MGQASVAAILGGIVATACFAFAPAAQAAVELRGAVPSSYIYELKWEPHARVLSGDGNIGFVNRGPAPIDRVWLRLRPNNGDRLERIKEVYGARISRQTAGGSMVQIKFDYPVDVGERTHLGFNFELKVPREDTSLGRSAGIELFGDALPVLAVDGPDGVRVGPEPSYGEGSLNPVAKWRVRVIVPRGLRAVFPGEQHVYWRLDKGTSYVSNAQVRDVAFAIGRFSTLTRKVDRIRVSVVGAAAVRAELPAALRRAVHAFTTLQRWYGAYNLPALRVVVGDLEFGGSEYPGLVFSTPDNATIAHEVAHQWFYGMVGNDQYRDPFLDESLTAFSEQRFHHSYRCNLASPIDGRAHGLGTGMDYWQKHPAGYVHTIYRGGACALTVLQRDLGREVFDRALRAYVSANRDKIAGVDDFLAAIREAAPGYDLARWERLVGLS